MTSTAAAAAVAAAWGTPLAAQSLEGRVVEAGSGDPVEFAVVELVASRQVTLTDADGRFQFIDDLSELDALRIRRLGYATLEVAIPAGTLDAPVFELERSPVELEGVSTELSLPERWEHLGERLDERVGEWPGIARVAEVADLRPWDGEWEGDPYAFLHNGPLRVTWVHNEDPAGVEDRVFVSGYGTVTPEVWLDDRQVWLQRLLETPNESLCRVETYMPKVRPWWPGMPQAPEPTPQVRAYTCGFLTKVAEGLVEMCPVLQWDRLFSGPGAGGSGLVQNRRAAMRPATRITPIDLGPGLDLNANAAGVRSGACLG